MNSRLFSILSALSLLLFVAVCVMWVRSYWVEEQLAAHADHLIVSRTGELTFCRFRSVQVEVLVQRRYAAVRRQLYATIWRDLWSTADTRWRFAGIAYARTQFGSGYGYALLALPYWLPAAISAFLPALWLLRVNRARVVRFAGLCVHCGYDLRATPDRCPECGTAAWGRAPAGRRTNSWPPRLTGSMLDIEKLRKARAKAGHVMKPPLFAAGVLAALAVGGCAKSPGECPGKNGVVTGTIGPMVQECLGLGGTGEANPECGGQKVQAGRTTHPRTASELERLQGTWEGAVVGDRSDDKITITITGNSLHFHRDTNFWFKTTFTLPAGTDPQELHATIKDCPPPRDSIGKVVVAFFKVEGGKLTLAAMGERTDEMPKSFEAADDEGWTRYELRKVQPQKENTEPPRTK